MENIKWMNLQLFAEGGQGATGDGGGAAGNSGGASAPSVEADPGRQRLLALGVPEDKINERAIKAAAAVDSVARDNAEAKPEQDAAAEGKPTEEATKKATWEEIIADPDYNREMQKTVNARLKTAKKAEEDLREIMPALDIFAKHYGLQIGSFDLKTLAQKICDDESLFEKKAVEMGTDTAIARKLALAEIGEDRQKLVQQQTARERALAQHREKLEAQVPAMREMFPNFDLDKELENPYFARMVGPGNVFTLEQAYHAIHYKDIQAAQAKLIADQTAKQLAATVQANSRRPVEAGASGAPSVTNINWKNASKEQREALKRQIMDAAARGEKIYPR